MARGKGHALRYHEDPKDILAEVKSPLLANQDGATWVENRKRLDVRRQPIRVGNVRDAA
ncbi:MAG: hypothetical protein ACJ8EL_18665 [Rhizomicrobium sp.]